MIQMFYVYHGVGNKTTINVKDIIYFQLPQTSKNAKHPSTLIRKKLPRVFCLAQFIIV